jgi:hypothetical protein
LCSPVSLPAQVGNMATAPRPARAAWPLTPMTFRLWEQALQRVRAGWRLSQPIVRPSVTAPGRVQAQHQPDQRCADSIAPQHVLYACVMHSTIVVEPYFLDKKEEGSGQAENPRTIPAVQGVQSVRSLSRSETALFASSAMSCSQQMRPVLSVILKSYRPGATPVRLSVLP